MIKRLWHVLRGKPTDHELDLIVANLELKLQSNLLRVERDKLRDKAFRLQVEADSNLVVLLKREDEIERLLESLADRRAKVEDLKRILKTMKGGRS